MNDLLAYLKFRIDELKTAQAQAIHSLGVVTGRLEELEDLHSKLVDASDPTNPDEGAPAPSPTS